MAHHKADDKDIKEEEASEASENEDFVHNARIMNPLSKQQAKTGPALTVDQQNASHGMHYLQREFGELVHQRRTKAKEEKLRLKRLRAGKLNKKDPEDIQRQKETFYNQDYGFKSPIMRGSEMVYKMIEDVPENANAGRHRVDHSYVDKKSPAADIKFREKSPVKERHF